MADRIGILALRGLTRGQIHWGSFPAILRQKAPQFDFENLELPGNGTRFQEKTPLSATDVIADLKGHSRLVSQGKPFALLGISLGGMISLKWAELFPQDLLGITIINSSLAEVSPLYRRFQPPRLIQTLQALKARLPLDQEKYILHMTSNNPTTQSYLPEFAAFAEQHPVRSENFFRQLLLASRIQVKSPLAVKLQVLVSQKDRLVHPSCSEALAKKFSTYAISHPSAGHDLPLDEPEWLAQQLIKFLT